MFSIISYLCQNIRNLYIKSKNVNKNLTVLKQNILTRPSKSVFFLSYLSFFEFLFPGLRGKNDTYVRYWLNKDAMDVITEADNLYSEGKYLEVYEILNRIQFYDNVDIRWRICRALYKMSTTDTTPAGVRDNMIMEAYGLIVKTLDITQNNAEVHKWMAIILDSKTALEGTLKRVRAAPTVKEHMLKCTELNPKDASVYHMLGYWCYHMTKLTRFQRYIVKIFLCDPPESSYQEAYDYFMKAEELQPRSFAENIFMLGKCCYEMGMYYRARYYLLLASNLPERNALHKRQADEAKFLAETLKDYDVTEHLLSLTE